MLKYDKRHTTKPHTENQWNHFYRMTKSFKTEILAFKYGVSKQTIYNWKWEYKCKKGKNNGRINIRNNTSNKI